MDGGQEVIIDRIGVLARARTAFPFPLRPLYPDETGLNDLAVAILLRRSRIPNLADPWFES
jgi:hypothetical protein